MHHAGANVAVEDIGCSVRSVQENCVEVEHFAQNCDFFLLQAAP